MKIAIAAVEPDLFSSISPQGARAPFYLVFDAEGKLVEALTNPHVQAAGAGQKVADMLFEKDIHTFVAADLGPVLRDRLLHHNIRYLQKTGLVNDVLKELGSG